MPNAIYFISYKLKKGADVQDFLTASENLNNEYMSKQNGYISWTQLVDGETRGDLLTFETMEDAKKAANPSNLNDLLKKFYSFINLSTINYHLFSVERSY